MVPELTCQQLVEWVTAFLDGALDPRCERLFIDHLARCEGCENYLDQVRRTVCSLGELPNETLPGAVRAELLRAFRDWPGRDDRTGPPDPPDADMR